MAVFTEVSIPQAQNLMHQLGLGPVLELKGIEGGIENTNYFVTTAAGEFVLTLFERLNHTQLPFYLKLMRHLAQQGLPVPLPRATANLPEEILHTVAGKPAAVVSRLAGQNQLFPQPGHCASLGALLAQMHLAGQGFELQQPNLRGLAWWNETIPVVMPFLNASQQTLISQELGFQNQLAQTHAYLALPRGPVHADLFRDNAMFVGDNITGVFDFYFAGVDSWLFDLAVCLNDWCIDHQHKTHDAERAQALLAAYQRIRPLTPEEVQLLPAMLRAGALRFWTSRLWDYYLPRDASMLKPHDPTHFEHLLRHRVLQPITL